MRRLRFALAVLLLLFLALPLAAQQDPLPPTNIQVTATTTSFTVTWTPATGAGANDHTIRWRTEGTNTWTGSFFMNRVASGVTITQNLTSGTTYEFQVATRIGSATTWSDTQEVTLPLPAPTNIQVTATATKFTVTWTPDPGTTKASQHTIRWREQGTATWALGFVMENVASGVTIFQRVMSGTTYEFEVGTTKVGAATTWSTTQTVTLLELAAPTNIQTTTTETSFTVTWTPDSNVEAANQHAIRWRIENGTSWTTQASVTSGVTITGLDGDTTYEFEVGTARAARQSIVWSTLQTVTLPEAEQDLGPSTNIQVTDKTATSFTVTWTPDPNAEAGDHSIRWREQNGTWTTDTNMTSPVTITGLTSGATYEFEVGTETDGDTLWSDTQTVTLPVAVPVAEQEPEQEPELAAPTNIQVTDRTATSFTVTWTPDPNAEAGDHSIRWREQNGTWTTDTNMTSPVTITRLTSGATYEFEVGTETDGDTAWSATQTVTLLTTTDELAAPTNVMVTHGDAQLKVTWTNGTGADSHTVRWRTSASGGTAAGAWTEITNATSPQTISNLENDTAYDVQVGAVAAGETTQWSSTVQGTPEEPKGTTTDEPPTTPDNAPAGYLEPSLSVGNGTLSVSWEPFANYTYDVRWRPATNTNTWPTGSIETDVSSPHTITGLSNGTAYEVQVLGKDAGGVARLQDSVVGTPRSTALTAPKGVTVTAGNRSLGVSWNRVNAATTYTVRARVTTGNPYDPWTTTEDGLTVLTYTIEMLEADTTYDVQVGAVRDNETKWSETERQLTNRPSNTLTAPVLKVRIESSTSLRLTWSMVSGLTYTVEWREVGEGTWETTSPASSDFILGATNALTKDQAYEVRVTASDGTNDAESNVVTATPLALGAPTNVQTTPGETTIVVTWEDESAWTYEVRWREGATGDWLPATPADTAFKSYTITGLTGDTAYQVQVGSRRNSTSVWADIVDVRTTTPSSNPVTLEAPTGVTVVAGDQRELDVSWTAVDGATEYIVEWRTLPGSGPWDDEATVTARTHTITDLEEYTLYGVRVTASDGTDKSDPSPEVTARTLQAPFTVHPVSDEELLVDWDAVTGATSYRVRWKVRGAAAWEREDTRATSPLPLQYIIFDLEDDTWYEVQVGWHDGTRTTWFDTREKKTQVQELSDPSNFNVTVGEGELTATWTDDPAATEHLVRWREATPRVSDPWPDPNPNQATVTNGTETYRIIDLTGGTAYHVQVGATNGSRTVWSGVATATPRTPVVTPGPPTGFGVTLGDGQLRVVWENAPGADSHTVEWKQSSVIPWTDSSVGRSTDASSPHTIPNLTNDTPYDVRVGAVFGSNVLWSPVVKAVRPRATFRGRPVVTVDPGDEQLVVSWTSVNGATGYEVQWKLATTQNWTGRIGEHTTSGTVYTIPSLTNGTAYDVRVEATDGRNRATSAEVQATPVAECVEDGRYMQGSVGRPKRTHKGGPRQYGYTSCLHDGRFKVTATDLNDDPAPVSHRIRSASGTEDATVLFKLDGDKLLYVNVASYCHLADQGFEHYVVDVDTYGERATFEVTIEDLEGGTTKVYRSADSADENLDMQAFRCVP